MRVIASGQEVSLGVYESITIESAALDSQGDGSRKVQSLGGLVILGTGLSQVRTSSIPR